MIGTLGLLRSISQSSRGQKLSKEAAQAERVRLLRLLYLEVLQNLQVLDRVAGVGRATTDEEVGRDADAYLFVGKTLEVEAHRIVLLAALEAEDDGFFKRMGARFSTADKASDGPESFTSALSFVVFKAGALRKLAALSRRAEAVRGGVRGRDRLQGLMDREVDLRQHLETHAEEQLGDMICKDDYNRA